MSQVLNLYKPPGITPLQTIRLLRQKYSEYQSKTLGYAGRLDPMAEGVLLILVDEENKKRKKYEQLEKEYIVDILLGIETDSYDVLGKVTHLSDNISISSSEMSDYINALEGKMQQPYPPYSSPRINGKSLYYWTRTNMLHTIKIPVKNVKIYKSELISIRYISASRLLEDMPRRIAVVMGDFRQEEIIAHWKQHLTGIHTEFPVLQVRIACSSGTYMRSIAHTMGKALGVGGLAYHIIRTKVGNHGRESSIILSSK